MSYVAVSKTLVDDIKGKINILRQSEEFHATKAFEGAKSAFEKAYTTMMVKEIEAKQWEGNEDIRERLRGFDVETLVSVELVLSHEFDGEAREVRAPLYKSVPARFPCFNRDATRGWGVTIRVNPAQYFSPNINELLSEFISLRLQLAEVTARWDKVRTQVVDFVQSAKSLNEALKLWPDLQRYVPKDYLDRVAQKSEKAQKKESAALQMLAAMDMNAINTSTVLARMAGAKI